MFFIPSGLHLASFHICISFANATLFVVLQKPVAFNLCVLINLAQKDVNAGTIGAIINDCRYIVNGYQFYLLIFQDFSGVTDCRCSSS